MKSLNAPGLVLLLAWIAPIHAFAGNEGPHGVPSQRRSPYFAQVTREPLAGPGSSPSSIVFRVSGEIVAYDPVSSPRVLGRFSPDTLDALRQKALKLRTAELEDTDPGLPMCSGGSIITYSTVDEEGKTHLIGKDLACHEFRSYENATSRSLVSVMSAFRRLSDIPSKPGASDVDRSGVLAEVVSEGGHRAPSAPRSVGTRVLRSGAIVDFADAASHASVQLSPELTDSLSGMIEKIPSEPLAEPDPRSPYACADAPVTRYSAFRADGSAVLLSQILNCVSSSSPDPSADALVGILRGLQHLRF